MADFGADDFANAEDSVENLPQVRSDLYGEGSDLYGAGSDLYGEGTSSDLAVGCMGRAVICMRVVWGGQ